LTKAAGTDNPADATESCYLSTDAPAGARQKLSVSSFTTPSSGFTAPGHVIPGTENVLGSTKSGKAASAHWEVLEWEVTVVCGIGLMPKDSSFFHTSTSDPYVMVDLLGENLGKTRVISKNLNPVWNKTFKHDIYPGALGGIASLSGKLAFKIFDHNGLSKDVPMGEVLIPVKNCLHFEHGANCSLLERKCRVRPCKGCEMTKGDLKIKVSVQRANRLSRPAPPPPPTSETDIPKRGAAGKKLFKIAM